MVTAVEVVPCMEVVTAKVVPCMEVAAEEGVVQDMEMVQEMDGGPSGESSEDDFSKSGTSVNLSEAGAVRRERPPVEGGEGGAAGGGRRCSRDTYPGVQTAVWVGDGGGGVDGSDGDKDGSAGDKIGRDELAMLGIQVCPDPSSLVSSHTLYKLNGLKRLSPPQNRQLNVQ